MLLTASAASQPASSAELAAERGKPVTTASGCEIEFEIAVAGRRFERGLTRAARHHGAAEIGVEHDARCVHDAPGVPRGERARAQHGRRGERIELGGRPGPGRGRSARLIESGARAGDGRPGREVRERRRERRRRAGRLRAAHGADRSRFSRGRPYHRRGRIRDAGSPIPEPPQGASRLPRISALRLVVRCRMVGFEFADGPEPMPSATRRRRRCREVDGPAGCWSPKPNARAGPS